MGVLLEAFKFRKYLKGNRQIITDAIQRHWS